MVHFFTFTCSRSAFQPFCVQDLSSNDVLNMRELELTYKPQRNYEFPIWAVYLVRSNTGILKYSYDKLKDGLSLKIKNLHIHLYSIAVLHEIIPL